jgi:hypothetical protein
MTHVFNCTLDRRRASNNVSHTSVPSKTLTSRRSTTELVVHAAHRP